MFNSFRNRAGSSGERAETESLRGFFWFDGWPLLNLLNCSFFHTLAERKKCLLLILLSDVGVSHKERLRQAATSTYLSY